MIGLAGFQQSMFFDIITPQILLMLSIVGMVIFKVFPTKYLV